MISMMKKRVMYLFGVGAHIINNEEACHVFIGRKRNGAGEWC